MLNSENHDEASVASRAPTAKISKGPAPLRSQDPSRRLLSGQSGAWQGALPLPWGQVHRSEDAGRSCAHC